MTASDQPVVTAVPPELRVDAARVINSLRQRLSEEISKSVVLEVALAESQERERSLSVLLAQQRDAAADLPSGHRYRLRPGRRLPVRQRGRRPLPFLLFPRLHLGAQCAKVGGQAGAH